MENYKEILKNILEEYQAQAQLKAGEIFVIGCSTSEVVGGRIGKNSSMDVAEDFIHVFLDFAHQYNLYLAFQGCEHINRSLVVSRACMEKYNLDQVSVVPKIHAGGSMATVAYEKMSDPVMVENIQAHGGIDIGDTFIGMHIKAVGVPVRVGTNKIGSAHVTFIRRRPKLVGGQRAEYK